MKKASEPDDLRPEYDFSSMRGGVRGKYVQRYRAGVNLVLLEPELAKAFPTDAAVNEALRAALRTSKPRRRAVRLPNNAIQLTKRGSLGGKTSKPRRRRH
jgi:hypothetical protein